LFEKIGGSTLNAQNTYRIAPEVGFGALVVAALLS
jgi:hypothetical protein